jgi:hypothetical protein
MWADLFLNFSDIWPGSAENDAKTPCYGWPASNWSELGASCAGPNGEVVRLRPKPFAVLALFVAGVAWLAHIARICAFMRRRSQRRRWPGQARP